MAQKAKRSARPAKPKPKSASKPRLTTARLIAGSLLILFALGAWLRVEHVSDVKYRTADEVLYTHDAREIYEKGGGAGLTVPRKAGYLVLLVGAMKISGVADEQVGAWLSCVASVAALALIGWIGVCFLSPWAAIYAMLAMSFSILDLACARRCWQESIMEFLGLLLVWSAAEITRRHNQRWNYALLIAAGLSAVVVKQLGVFICVGTALYVLTILYLRRDWQALVRFAAAGLIAAAIATWALAGALGGFGQLHTFWDQIYVGPATNPESYPWAARYQAGPWGRVLSGFWILMPVNLVFDLVAVLLAFSPAALLARCGFTFRPSELGVLRLCCVTTGLMLLVILLMPLSQNFRYLAPSYGPMHLLGGIGFAALMQQAARLRRDLAWAAAGVLTMAALAGAVSSYRDFELLFVRGQVPDLSVAQVAALPYVKAILSATQPTDATPMPTVPARPE